MSAMDALEHSASGKERAIEKQLLAIAGDQARLQTHKDMEDLTYLLASGFVVGQLQTESDGAETERLEKLFDVCVHIRTALKHKESPVRTLPVTDRLCSILDRYETALARYLTGEENVQVYPDTGVLGATLDYEDTRWKHRIFGVSDETGARDGHLFTRVTEAYKEHGVFNSQSAVFIMHDVPYETYDFFMSHFNAIDLEVFEEDIHSERMAETIALAPHNKDYVTFIARILKSGAYAVQEDVFVNEKAEMLAKTWRRYGHTSLDMLLYTAWKKNTPLVESLLEYTLPQRESDAVHLTTVALLLNSPRVDQTELLRDLNAYENRLSSPFIAHLHLFAASPQKALEYMEMLPYALQDEELIYRLVAHPKEKDVETLKSFVSTWRTWGLEEEVEHLNTSYAQIYAWYEKDVVAAKRTISICRAQGMKSFEDLFGILSNKEMPPREWLAWGDAIGNVKTSPYSDSGRAHVYKWKEGKLQPSDVAEAKELWATEELDWVNVEAEDIKAYLVVKKNPALLQEMRELCAEYDILYTEVVKQFATGYRKKHFELLEEVGIGYQSLPMQELARAHPDLVRLFPQLDESQQREFLTLTVQDVAAAQKIRKKALTEIIEKKEEKDSAHGARSVDIADNAGEEIRKDDYAKLLDAVSDMHVWYVQLFEFFGVSPGYMAERLPLAAQKRELNDALVDHIILCAYLENKMPTERRVLVERYHILSFTRYPVAVLESMCEELTAEDCDDLCVVLQAKTDWMSSEHVSRSILGDVARHKRVVVYEVGSIADVYRSIREMGEACKALGKKLPMIMISGHGDERSISLGYPQHEIERRLNRTNVESLAPLREYFAKDMQPVLMSCGAEGVTMDGSPNFARRLKDVWGVEQVWASPVPGNSIKKIFFDDDGKVEATAVY